MRVAAIQYAPEFKAVSQNIEAAARLVVEAAKGGAQLCILPELCTTGYSFLSVKEAAQFAEVLGPPTSETTIMIYKPDSFRVMQTLAQKLGVAIAWGVLERDPATGLLHNSQVLVVPDGRYWVCRKINFFANDYIWATPGTASPPIGEFLGKKVGLLICADVRDKSDKIEDFYEPGDADIVMLSAAWGDGGFPAGKWVKFAKNNQCWLAVSNRYGQEQNNNFGEGGVCVIEPCGKVHCQGLRWNEPCIVYADVP